METRARHVLIGLFTLAVGVAAVLFTLWLGRSDSQRDFHLYDIAFEEAVSGLSRGSTVEFNGIRVGDVVDLRHDVLVFANDLVLLQPGEALQPHLQDFLRLGFAEPIAFGLEAIKRIEVFRLKQGDVALDARQHL